MLVTHVRCFGFGCADVLVLFLDSILQKWPDFLISANWYSHLSGLLIKTLVRRTSHLLPKKSTLISKKNNQLPYMGQKNISAAQMIDHKRNVYVEVVLTTVKFLERCRKAIPSCYIFSGFYIFLIGYSLFILTN